MKNLSNLQKVTQLVKSGIGTRNYVIDVGAHALNQNTVWLHRQWSDYTGFRGLLKRV